MNATRGYIFLEPQHPIVEDIIREKLNAYKEPNAKGEKSLELMNTKISDFDGVSYQVVVNKEQPNILQLNLFMSVLKDLNNAGANKVISSTYGKYKKASPANNSDLTLEIDASSVSNIDETAVLMGLLRRNLLAAPFDTAFEALIAGDAGNIKPTVLQTREKEQIIIQPLGDRVNVAFSIEFAEETDRAMADVFLQEFTEARRNQPNAPNVKHQRDMPNELRGVNGVQVYQSTVGFLMFTVLKTHVDGGKMEKVVTLLLGLRSYLHYHIKASKAHLHQRMRAKVKDFLLVLNRARPDEEKKYKATRVIN